MPGPSSMLAMVRVVFVGLLIGASPRNLEWTDQARGPAKASIAFPQRLRRFFSPATKRRHSSRDKKAVCPRPPLCCGLKAAGRSIPGPRTAIEAAMVAARQRKEDHHGYHRHLHR